jgi:NADH-quinone oxidoreductase subunit L
MFSVGTALPTAIALLFFLGATGKSAQIPLYVWLPVAMEGPTPVSALIHAATMVTAGVYLFVRSSSLFLLAPDALVVVAVIGAATAIVAASIGLVQNDIKRVLAYSTVSQLGFMFMAVGAGAFVAAIFHLMTHAFFKALLFLGSGSVIEACHHEQDVQKMGGLRKKLPVTYTTFVVGALALAGVPAFAGFFSKDEILFDVFTSDLLGPTGSVLWVVGAAAALMTAFYIARVVMLTFHGEPRDRHIYDEAKESPKVMTVPLVILAVLAAGGGFLGIPIPSGLNAVHNWLSPVFGGHGEGHDAAGAGEVGHSLNLELTLMAISVAIAVVGILIARHVYTTPDRAKAIGDRLSTAYRILFNKYYVDEFYHAVIVRPLMRFSDVLWALFDVQVIDGMVNGAGKMMRGTGSFLRPIQSGFTGSYAASIMVGAIVIVGYVLFGGGR